MKLVRLDPDYWASEWGVEYVDDAGTVHVTAIDDDDWGKIWVSEEL